MDEYAEDWPGPQLPDWAEKYLAGERERHRLLRRTGLAAPAQSAEALTRWMER